MTNAVLWVEVVIFAIFVALRLYTRKEILNAVGADDYLTVLALVRSITVYYFAVLSRLMSCRLSIFFTPFSSR